MTWVLVNQTGDIHEFEDRDAAEEWLKPRVYKDMWFLYPKRYETNPEVDLLVYRVRKVIEELDRTAACRSYFAMRLSGILDDYEGNGSTK